MYYDIFNGDADGICALVQLRLAKPLESTLITGIKRDIQLLKKVNALEGDELTVLDISMQKNSQQLNDFLTKGVSIFYADHHQAGDIPEHPKLTALIDTRLDTCTGLIINKYLFSQNQLIYQQLENAYLQDMQKAKQVNPKYSHEKIAVFILPNLVWARRVSGVFSNYLANQYPDRAHAILTFTPDNDYQVSVRAPLNNKIKTDELCALFPQEADVRRLRASTIYP